MFSKWKVKLFEYLFRTYLKWFRKILVSNKRRIAHDRIKFGTIIIVHVIDYPLKKIFGMHLCSLQANGLGTSPRFSCFIRFKLKANNINFLESFDLGKSVEEYAVPATWFQDALWANFFNPSSKENGKVKWSVVPASEFLRSFVFDEIHCCLSFFCTMDLLKRVSQCISTSS